jgi:hypothetical protein
LSNGEVDLDWGADCMSIGAWDEEGSPWYAEESEESEFMESKDPRGGVLVYVAVVGRCVRR